MDDPKLSAPPRPHPKPTPGNLRHRASRAASGPQSIESRFIGYLVLGFGVLAVITVLILAFSRGEDEVLLQSQQNVPASQNVAEPQQRMSEAEAGALVRELGITPAPVQTPIVRTETPKLAFRRQNNVPASQLVGAWQTMIGNYVTVAQLDGKVYQIILASGDPNADRVYSSGTYSVNGDVLTFTPQIDWPPPNPGGSQNVRYSMLTRASFSFLVGFQKGRMLWQNAPEGVADIYTTPRSPIFMNEDINYVVWQKIAR